MNPRTKYNKPIKDYWKYPEEGYPKTIYWKVIAGNRRLDVLQDHDLLFSENDQKWANSL